MYNSIFAVTGGADMAAFIVTYVTIMTSMFTLNTMNYDEMDNSITYLMTMPTGRRSYVIEKYWYSQLACLAGWGVSTAIVLFLIPGDYLAFFLGSLSILVVVAVTQFIILPLQLKFGADKGKVILLGIVLIFIGGFMAIGKIGESMYGDENGLSNILMKIMIDIGNTNRVLMVVYGVIIYLVTLLASVTISTHIVEKKEY